MTTSAPDLLSVTEAAQVIGIDRATLTQRILRGQFPSYPAPADWQPTGRADEPRYAIRREDAAKARRIRDLQHELRTDAATRRAS